MHDSESHTLPTRDPIAIGDTIVEGEEDRPEFYRHQIGAEGFVVDVDGFEGPLDLLLAMARRQKVDLRMISVLDLAEQYLQFVKAARLRNIELAADYLVMAAWLAFLKSRLLLPPEADGDEPDGEELAAHLAFQLERLEAMREAGARLMARDRLGRDVFSRGQPEALTTTRRVEFSASLLELLQAYSSVRTRDSFVPLTTERDWVVTVEQALDRLRPLIRNAFDWGTLWEFLPRAWLGDPVRRRSATAATFAAALELARLGQMEIRQTEAFADIQIRVRS